MFLERATNTRRFSRNSVASAASKYSGEIPTRCSSTSRTSAGLTERGIKPAEQECARRAGAVEVDAHRLERTVPFGFDDAVDTVVDDGAILKALGEGRPAA
jgi:hypothetical protein